MYYHTTCLIQFTVGDNDQEGVADSGAQSCLLSLRQFYKCGFKKSHMIPVKLKMEAANRKSIEILGAVFLTITASGQTTHAMVYVSPDVQGFYISKQCLTELGCLSRSFPCAGEIERLESAAIIGSEINYNDEIRAAPPFQAEKKSFQAEKKAKCGCLLRKTPPQRPSVLPMPCTPANIDRMKEWLINTYAASTFNKCTHQTLPFIKAEPVKLHVDERAKPIAHHTPSIVPIHFRNKVKEGLDADERLGVIEKSLKEYRLHGYTGW